MKLVQQTAHIKEKVSVMKNIKFIILIGVILSLITACNKPVSKVEVYSVSGENEEIRINNGPIIITDELDEFIGGDLSFKNEEMTDVKEYVETFFYDKDREKTVIIKSGSIVEGEKNNTEMITISGENLFHDNDFELIKDSLSFSLNGKLMNGEDFDYQLTLDVQKAD